MFCVLNFELFTFHPKTHKVGSVVTKVCFWFVWCDFLLILTALSLVGGQSVYAVGLSSPLSKSSFIYFILGGFAPQKLDRPILS